MYQGRFNKPEQYADIVVRAKSTARSLHLKDIADVELGSEFFDIYSNLNGHPSAAIVLKQNFGSNASDVIADVKEAAGAQGAVSPRHDLRDQLRRLAVSRRLDREGRRTRWSRPSCWSRWSSSSSWGLAVDADPTRPCRSRWSGTFTVLQMMGMTINLITLFALVLSHRHRRR